MKVNDFEKMSRQQLLGEDVEIDLFHTWKSVENRLDRELPPRKKNGLGFFWVLILFLSGGFYCFSDSLISEFYSASANSVSAEQLSDAKIEKRREIPLNGEVEQATPTLVKNQLNHETSDVAHADLGVAKKNTALLSVNSQPDGSIATAEVVKKSKLIAKPLTLELRVKKNGLSVAQNDLNIFSADHFPDVREESLSGLSKISSKSFSVQQVRHMVPLSEALFAGIKILPEQESENISFRISTGASIQINKYQSQKEEHQRFASRLNQAVSNLETNHAAVLISKHMSPLRLTSGIQFQRIKEVLKMELISQIEREVEDVLLEIRINPHTMDSTFVHGTITQKGQSYQSVRHYNSMNIWSVPLQLEYLPPHDKWGFGLSTGLLFTVSQSKTGRFLQLDGSVSDVETRHPKSIHYLTIEPIISLKLGSPFSIEARPRLQRGFSRNTEVHSIFQRKTLIGLDLSLRYHPWTHRRHLN